MKRKGPEDHWRDSRNWILGGLYYCRDDPRFIVPRDPGRWGWTFNLARRRTYVFLAGLIAVVVGPVLALKYFGADPTSAVVLAAVGIPAAVVLYILFFGDRRRGDAAGRGPRRRRRSGG